jgi:O-antigen ligase
VLQRQAHRVAHALVLCLPHVGAFAVFIYLTVRGGGFESTVWYPAAIVVGGIALTALLATWVARPRLDPVTGSIALLAAFCGWNYLSIAWAADKGIAWDGANRIVFYVIVYALFALAAPRVHLFAWLLAATAVAVAVSLFVVLHTGADAGSTVFVAGRMAAPLDYPNATAAVLLVPAWTAIALVAAPMQSIVVRAVALAAAGALVELELLTRSRGAVAANVVAGLFLLVWSKRRLLAVWVLVTLLGTAIVFYATCDAVNGEWADRPPAGSIRHAEVVIVLTAAVLGLLGLVAAGAARAARRRWPRAWLRAARINGAVVVAVLAVGVVAGAVRIGSPSHAARSAWHSFKHAPEPGGQLRLTTLGSNRYDFWRVSLIVFRDHPIAGVGSENFGSDYVRLRRSDEQPAFPHSFVMQVLEQTGIVGAILFAAFLGAAGVAAFRARRLPAALAGAAGFVYFLAHASVDWLWEFPALGALGFAGAGIAVASARTRAAAAPPVARSHRGLAAAALVCCIGALVPVWISDRDTATANATWIADPPAAFALYDRAADEDPLDDTPLVTAGVVAGHLGEFDRMASYFTRAVGRNGRNWFSQLELAVARSNRGRFDEAEAAARRAAFLNPREGLVRTVLERIRAGRPVSPRFVEDQVYQESRSVLR